ncbi:MAG: hypothetical protein P8Z79_15210, partial [Sedimentisphaerales bacterium]
MKHSNTTKMRAALWLLTIVLTTVTGSSGTNGGVSNSERSDGMKKTREYIKAAVTIAENRRALGAYQKRDPEIIPWRQNTVPPNPGNAALLYYQAFLLRPEPNTVILRKIDDVLRGAEPDRQIKRYLGSCLPMIEMVEIASRIPECTWGIWHGSELNSEYPTFLFDEVSYLTHILSVDARVAAINGNCQAALDRCLTIRRLARHLSNNPELDLFARNPDLWALRTIQYVLSVMPPDEDILMWFRGQLSVVHGLRLSGTNMFYDELKSFSNQIQTDPTFVGHLRDLLIDKAEDKKAKENERNLPDEEIRSRSRKEFPRFVDSILRILDSDMTYEEKSTKLQRIISDVKENDSVDPVSKCIILASGVEGLIDRQYPFLVGHKAHVSAIKTAVEVYLIVAETGRLP